MIVSDIVNKEVTGIPFVKINEGEFFYMDEECDDGYVKRALFVKNSYLFTKNRPLPGEESGRLDFFNAIRITTEDDRPTYYPNSFVFIDDGTLVNPTRVTLQVG
jgi:hypothetical protein